METPAFLKTALPLVLIPSACWLLGLFAMRGMDRTRKDWLSALSLIAAVLLMIALLLFRLLAPAFAPATGFRLSGKALLLLATLTLLCGVGIFLRAWSLYRRDKLSAEEIAPYCAACFLIPLGAAIAFPIAYLYAPA